MAFEWIRKVKDTNERLNDFLLKLDEGGLWWAVTGKHFTESVRDFLLFSSDYLIGVTAVAGLFAMMGSKRAANIVYWTMGGYIVIKAIGSAYQ